MDLSEMSESQLRKVVGFVIEHVSRGLTIDPAHAWFLDGKEMSGEEFCACALGWEERERLKKEGRLQLLQVGYCLGWDLWIETTEHIGPSGKTPLEALILAADMTDAERTAH